MSEAVAQRKSKSKKKVKQAIENEIPDLPDFSKIDILQPKDIENDQNNEIILQNNNQIDHVKKNSEIGNDDVVDLKNNFEKEQEELNKDETEIKKDDEVLSKERDLLNKMDVNEVEEIEDGQNLDQKNYFEKEQDEVEIKDEDEVLVKEREVVNKTDVKELEDERNKRIIKSIFVKENKDLEVRKMEITLLYPSLTSVLEDNLVRNQDGIIEETNNPEAPVELWVLPEAMSKEALFQYYYNNPLLEQVKVVENELNKLMLLNRNTHHLYVLINAYQRALQSRAEFELQFANIRENDVNPNKYQLWTIRELSETRQGRCRDNAIVKTTFNYVEAKFDEVEAAKLNESLCKLNGEHLDGIIMSIYEAGLRKQLVNEYLSRVKEANPIDCVSRDVNECLMVLFEFIRKPSHHKELLAYLKTWIILIGGIVTRLGNIEDRLALLWQLLHCPGGVAQWAVGLIQWRSNNNITEEELALGGLQMILSSQVQRQVTLNEWNLDKKQKKSVDEWTIVDSEGEDDEPESTSWYLLRESDVVGFMDQIPLGRIFKQILQALDDGIYDPNRGCNANNILNVMGFCAKIIDILGEGLSCYQRQRYRQVNKRMSRLIKHTVQFLTDHLECVLCIMNTNPEYYFKINADLILRLLAQYEAIFNQAIDIIIQHRLHDNWQSLPDIPTRMLSPPAKIHLFHKLLDPQNYSPNSDITFNTQTHYVNLLQSHLELIDSSTSISPSAANSVDSDSVYLLTILSNIALDCRNTVQIETKLLQFIIGVIFEVCYVNPSTRTIYAKLGRELLSTVAIHHHQALSSVLENLKLWHPSVGQMALFLLRELPICFFYPSESEFRLLLSWLLENPLNSIPNGIARYILLHLNWGFAKSDQTCLYLPLSMHYQMAQALCTCYRINIKAGGVQSTSSWIVHESMKLIQNLWWFNQDDISITNWCLALASRLRLHKNQRPRAIIPLNDTIDNFQLTTDNNPTNINPVSMYISAVTNPNPDDYSSSLITLNQLIIKHNQYRLALELLTTLLISPAHLNFLQSNDLFLASWKEMLHSDDSYYQLAKSYILNSVGKSFPGPTLSCITSQFCPSIVLALDDPLQQRQILQFFLNITLEQYQWYLDVSMVHLIDHLLLIDTVLELEAGAELIFKVVTQHHDKQIHDASRRTTLSQLFSRSNNYTPLTALITSNSCIWLRSYLLEAQVKLELSSQIWPVFSQKILSIPKSNRKNSSASRRNPSAALSSTVKHLKLPMPLNFNSLAIIQTALSISECPPHHPGLLILCGIFFPRFLSPAFIWQPSLIGAGSVGYLIFQEDYCHAILMKCRATIAAAKSHFTSELESTNQSDLTKLDQLKNIAATLETVLLWIDEPRLHMPNVDLTNLPEPYRSDILKQMFRTPPVDQSMICLDNKILCLPRRFLLEDIRKSANDWTTRHDLDQRFLKLVQALQKKPFIPLQQKLFQRFQRQNSVLVKNPPEIANANELKPTKIPATSIESVAQTLEFIKGPLSVLNNCVSNYRRDKNFLDDLNKRFMQQLARNYEQQTINRSVQQHCNKGEQFCTGMATISLNYKTWIWQQHVTTNINRNRAEFNQLLNEIISFPSMGDLVKAILQVEHLIRKLNEKYQNSIQDGDTSSNKILNSALELFFYLGQQLTLETQKYPPHKHIISTFMDTLGAHFLPYSTNQAPKLLRGMLDNELLVNVYLSSFMPSIDVANTAQMYLDTMRQYNNIFNRRISVDADVNNSGDSRSMKSYQFILSILTKFKIDIFLQKCSNKSYKIDLINSIIKSLTFMVPKSTEILEEECLIETIHINNLVQLINSDFVGTIFHVLTSFRTECMQGQLKNEYWTKCIGQCIENNIKSNNLELGLTIDELLGEIDRGSVWLNNSRYQDNTDCYDYGIYCLNRTLHPSLRMSSHLQPIIAEVYDVMLESLMFKLARSAHSDQFALWNPVIGTAWDYFLRVYIPLVQTFPKPDNGLIKSQNKSGICLPWTNENTDVAESIFILAIERLGKFLTIITVEEGQSFLMLCVLIWIVNGLFGQKELPHKPYDEVYSKHIIKLNWTLLIPTYDCVKHLLEVFVKTWSSQESKELAIEIASQIPWMKYQKTLVEPGFISHLFEFVVTITCRTNNIFKLESTERFIDSIIELNWINIPSSNYKKGMSQLVANLRPSIILANETTIEGKFIKLLNCVSGRHHISANPQDINGIHQKMTIYVETVVKLLTVAFSFIQSSSSKSSGQYKDHLEASSFQLRVGVLFEEIEQVLYSADEQNRNNLALSLVNELLGLFRNTLICQLALEPTLTWIQQAGDNGNCPALLLPLMVGLYRWPPQIVPLVSIQEQLLKVYLASDNNDGSASSWASVTSFGTTANDLQLQQVWAESVRQNALACLVQQTMIHVKKSFVNNPDQSINDQRLLCQLSECLNKLANSFVDNCCDANEKMLIIFIYLLLRLLRTASLSDFSKTSNHVKQLSAVLLKLSESKKSSGLLGKVGLGRRSQLSFELRAILRSLGVFLTAQIPTGTVPNIRITPNQSGAITHKNMVITNRSTGEPLPTNKTMQNLEWLKSQSQNKELLNNPMVKQALEDAIDFICNPVHCMNDCVELLRIMCSKFWPQNKLLLIINSSCNNQF